MSCDIFIRSYWRDFEWLAYCLRSIEHHCIGFRDVHVVIPRGSIAWLRRHPPLPSWVRLHACQDYDDDYLGQQVTKLHADEVSNADLICHIDSDCLFRRCTSPDDLAPAGRPRIYTRPAAELPRHWPWLVPTAELLGWQPLHDYMQCPPFVFPWWLYGELRQWTSMHRGMALSEWVLSRPARGFSEFNALGAYACEFHREAFVWVRERDMGEEERPCDWHWSWGGLTDAQRTELQRAARS